MSTSPLLVEAAGRREISIDVEEYNVSRPLYSDKETADSLCNSVANFVISNGPSQYEDRMVQIRSRNRTIEDFRFVRDVINYSRNIEVQEDEVMRSNNRANTIDNTKIVTATTKDTHVVALGSDAAIAVGRGARITEQKTLWVSQKAFEGLDRHIFSLTTCGKITRIVRKFGPCCCCLSIVTLVAILNPPKTSYDDNKDD